MERRGTPSRERDNSSSGQRFRIFDGSRRADAGIHLVFKLAHGAPQLLNDFRMTGCDVIVLTDVLVEVVERLLAFRDPQLP